MYMYICICICTGIYIQYIYIYIYIYSTIYRHVFRCSTAHQCSLVQSGYGMATIYTQAIVSDNRLWDNSYHVHIQRALSKCSNYHKGSGLCILYIYIYIYIYTYRHVYKLCLQSRHILDL